MHQLVRQDEARTVEIFGPGQHIVGLPARTAAPRRFPAFQGRAQGRAGQGQAQYRAQGLVQGHGRRAGPQQAQGKGLSLAGARHMHGGQAVGHGGHRRQTGPEGGDAVGEKVGLLSLPRMDEGRAQAADAAEAELRQWAAKEGKYLTGRFSPGYGDWDIAVQPLVANALDTVRRAGLCVTDTNLMTPRKSVTAILGVSGHPVKGKLAGCGHCVLRTRCEYRKRGKTCASE